MITPSIGRIVHYTLTAQDAAEVNRRRSDAKVEGAGNTGKVVHVGNEARAGDIFPMLVTRVWGDTPDSSVQGQVFLDGNDTLWVTSVQQGDGERHWRQPSHV